MFQIIVILMLIAAQSSPANSTPLAEEHIRKAQAAVDNGRYGEATKELKAALKVSPDSLEAYRLLMGVYLHEGKMDDALKQAKNAVRYAPANPEAHYLLGVLLLQTDKMKEARQAITTGLSITPEYAPLYVLMGDLELATSKPVKGVKAYSPNLDSAIKAYEDALRLASPDERYVPVVRDRVAGLKNYIEFVLHEDDPSYVKAKQLNSPRPEYTSLARAMKAQGIIRAGVSINELGDVTSVTLFSRLGYGLEAEVVKALSRIKFSPATKAGKPVPFWGRVEASFSLQ
jgi:TonB family protein